MYMRLLLLATIFVLFNPVIVSAHSGRTNAAGCHIERKTGTQHCHNSEIPGAASVRTDVRVSARSSARAIDDDKDCADFMTQQEAQVFFVAHGGSVVDVHDLDRDHDGIACENLP